MPEHWRSARLAFNVCSRLPGCVLMMNRLNIQLSGFSLRPSACDQHSARPDACARATRPAQAQRARGVRPSVRPLPSEDQCGGHAV